MGPNIKVDIPEGMGEVMESLTSEILKHQPNDIYSFAFAHIDSLIKHRKAQSSGLSPSPTEEAGLKVPSGLDTQTDDEHKVSLTDDKPPEEPQSKDTSYGVEATAVRTLAASTGTVAILGTTAKVKESNESLNNTKDFISETNRDTENITSTPSEKISIPNDQTRENQREEEKKQYSSNDEKPPIPNEEVEKSNVKLDNQIKVTEAVENSHETEDTSKEPVKLTEFEEKKKIHEPKIVEEMSVKKEEKTEKVNNAELVLNKQQKEAEMYLPLEQEDEQLGDKSKEDTDQNSQPPSLNGIEVIKIIPESENVSPESSRTEDISSEQLKTNSVSDMSLTDVVCSEGEDAGRENAKAEELKEMVASHLTINSENDEGTSSSKDISSYETVGTVGSVAPTSHQVDESATITSVLNINQTKPVEQSNEDLIIKKKEISKISTNESTHRNSLESDNEGSLGSIVIEPSVGESESTDTTEIVQQLPGPIVDVEHISDQSVHSVLHTVQNDFVPELSSESDIKNINELDQYTDETNSPETAINQSTEHSLQDIFNDTIEQLLENTITVSSSEKSSQSILLLETDTTTEEEHQNESNLEANEDSEHEILSTESSDGGKKYCNDVFEKNVDDKVVHIKSGKKTENDNVEEKEKDEAELASCKIRLESSHSNTELEVTPLIPSEASGNSNSNHSTINEENSLIETAATTIQSGFRGYKARKLIKESKDEENKDKPKEIHDSRPESPIENVHVTDLSLKILDEKGQAEQQEKDLLHEIETEISEMEMSSKTVDDNTVPESLIEIAQAEVNNICQEAEKTTESIVSSMRDDKYLEDEGSPEEEFPAPPDDLLLSEGKNYELKEEHSSSETEPTVPFPNNTEDSSSKTEDTTAPSLAESELPKTPSQKNDDFRLECSMTENINTEVQRDSTEGELTMEEDSARDDEVNASKPSSQVEDLETKMRDEEKAAQVIQSGYREFRARKRVRQEALADSPEEDVETTDDTQSEPARDNIETGPDETTKLRSPDAVKELNESAKKIQAGVRGYLVRKKQKIRSDAAVKIQSHFRGFRARQNLKKDSS